MAYQHVFTALRVCVVLAAAAAAAAVAVVRASYVNDVWSVCMYGARGTCVQVLMHAKLA